MTVSKKEIENLIVEIQNREDVIRKQSPYITDYGRGMVHALGLAVAMLRNLLLTGSEEKQAICGVDGCTVWLVNYEEWKKHCRVVHPEYTKKQKDWRT